MKQNLTREYSVVLISRIFTKDNIIVLYDGLDSSFLPTDLRDVENYEYLFYFFQNSDKFVNASNAYENTFGNNYNLQENVTKAQFIQLFHYALERELHSLNLTESTPVDIQAINVDNIQNELNDLLKYEELQDTFLAYNFVGTETITLEEAVPLLKVIYEKSNTKPHEEKNLNPTYIYKKEDYNDPIKHNHPISDDPNQQLKHAILHAVLNYQTKYGEPPITDKKLENPPKGITDFVTELGYDINDFYILDTDALYPEFLMEPFTQDTAIVHPEYELVFFVKGYQLKDGRMAY